MVVTNNLPDNAIILGMLGRMGNNLFEIANGYCLSRETNRPFYLHLIDPITKELKHDALDIINRFDCIYDAKLAEGSVLIEQPLNQEFFDAKKYISSTKKNAILLGIFKMKCILKSTKKKSKIFFTVLNF